MWKKLLLWWKSLERWQRMLIIILYWIFSVTIVAFIPFPWDLIFTCIAGGTSGLLWAIGLY